LQASAAARARQGITDERSVLVAQAQVLQQRDAAIALDAQAISAQIALTKALGGGYHTEDDPAVAATGVATTSPINSERADSR
jgi:multidrug efflux system outer membrane protein